MADTGAPHFIPFVEPTDLVRDYPAADEAQALAIAAGLTEAGNAGIGSNVVQTVKTDTFVTTSPADFTEVTGLTVTITPTSASSKVLVFFSVAVNMPGSSIGSRGQISLFRGSTNLSNPDAPGNRTPLLANERDNPERFISLVSGHFLDSPSTLSPITYSVRVDTSETLFVNRSSSDTDTGAVGRATSYITAIEVAE